MQFKYSKTQAQVKEPLDQHACCIQKYELLKYKLQDTDGE
jgi:hypothetical protein